MTPRGSGSGTLPGRERGGEAADPPYGSGPHPLLRLLLDAADGRFPSADGGVTLLGPLPGGLECSVAFTGHAVIATALPGDEVRRMAPDGYGANLAPELLRAMAGREGEIGVVDVTLAARGTGDSGATAAAPLPERPDLHGHPRVRYARELRSHVRTFGDERGLVTLSGGLAGRREVSIELHEPGERPRGLGRSLLRDALAQAPDGEPVFAAVSPGNARSLRAFLAAGFTPLGSEVIVRPGRRSGDAGPGRRSC
ncbi:N-acetyltransferase [Streptomyces daqingensis]|uniref:N-acetyltransferase n=1 Tax=Streptomyces daqingensis TaxID=1472640 RepID=A0ABQ2MEZ4_9ACTN|nr:hypothetical protein [Streptomyces daqingensis]GGO50596.1 N-acetyltransferase [Streptomyces daqingensis]